MSKLGSTRGFSGISRNFYRKIGGKSWIFETQFLCSFAVLEIETQFYGYGLPREVQKNCWKRIFEFLIFYGFLGPDLPGFQKNRDFFALESKEKKNPQKMKISKSQKSASNKFFAVIWATNSQKTGFLALVQEN